MALRIVSVRLGGAPLNPGRYEAERQAMRAADPRRRTATAVRMEGELDLPSVGQLELLGAFTELLQVAGLEHDAGTSSLERGVPVEDALERFLEEQGFLISYVLLRRWTNARGFRVEKLQPRSYPEVVAGLRTERAARGRWTPERPTPKNERPPDLAPRDGEAPAGPRHRSWSYEDCLEALRRAIVELSAGAVVLDQRTYRAIARGREDMPAASTLSRVAAANGTTFSAMREEVTTTHKRGRRVP